MDSILGSAEGSVASIQVDPLEAISTTIGNALGIGKGVSGSIDLALALNALPEAFQ